MPRAKKPGTYLNVKIRQDLYDLLTQYSNESGVPKTTVTERALEAYLKEKMEHSTTTKD